LPCFFFSTIEKENISNNFKERNKLNLVRWYIEGLLCYDHGAGNIMSIYSHELYFVDK